MMYVASLAYLLSATFGVGAAIDRAGPAPAVRADTTQLPLTVDVLANMTAFWESFRQESDSIVTVGRKANQEPLSIFVNEGTKGRTNMQDVGYNSVVDMIAMARNFPAVAADLYRTHLTAQQWEQYRRSLFTAILTQQVTSSVTHAAQSAHLSIVQQNIAFLQNHPTEFAALVASKMLLPYSRTAIGHLAPQLTSPLWRNAAANTKTTFGDGHVYVIFFTAVWCGNCVKVYPMIDTLLKTLGPQGVRVVYALDATTMGGTEEPPEALEKEVTEQHLTAPVAFLSTIGQTGYFSYGAGVVLPTLAVIDKDGKVQDYMLGIDEVRQRLIADLTKLVAAAPAAKTP